jgi:hypothetical protein
VTVINVDMPFGSIVVFMIKWALAAVPALLILAFIGVIAKAVSGWFITGMAGIGRGAEYLEKRETFSVSTGSGQLARTMPCLRRQAAVASIDQSRYEACISDKVGLRLRAAAIGGGGAVRSEPI